MKENYLTNYLNKQFGKADNHLHEIGETFDEETVHQFRVSLKRIYAVYQFLEYVFPDEFEAKKRFERPKVPYKLLGNVRDLQVTQQVLAYYEERLEQHFSGIKKYLTKRRIKRSKDFSKWFRYNEDSSVIPHKGEILEQTHSLTDIKIVEKARVYALQLIEEVNDLVPSNEDKTWHKARMNMRKLRFLTGIIRNIDNESINSEAYKTIKKTGNLLGDWHDRIVLKEWVKDYISNTSKNNKIKRLKRLIKIDRELMLEKSEKLIKQLTKQDIFAVQHSVDFQK